MRVCGGARCKGRFFCLFVLFFYYYYYHACVETFTASCASRDCFGVRAVTGCGTNSLQTSAWSPCCFVHELVLGEPSAKSGSSASCLIGNASEKILRLLNL